MTSVAIVNRSTVVSDELVRAATAALQKQVLRDFAAAGWPMAEVAFHSGRDMIGLRIPPDNYQLIILDDTDQAGALGYHDLPQTPDGQPIGYVFAKTDLQYGLSWSVTASHELLELLADPWICNVAMKQSGVNATLFAWEVCDACEDDSLGYDIDGVRVSDFVFPAWFEDWRAPRSTRFDQREAIRAPLTLAPGGYISTFQPGQGWQQVNARSAERMAARIARGSFTRSDRRLNRNS